MSTSASERGLVFCLYEPKDPTSSTNTTTPPEVYDAKVKTITHLSSTDDKVSEGFPRINTMYEVENIRPLLSPAAYQEDVAANKATTRIKDYHVFKRIDGRERPDLGTAPCPKGTTMVCVGITPKPETYEDFHNWYKQEHIETLSKVPGWRRSVRYELVEAYGTKGGVTPFVALHFYDEINGLGGPEWQASVGTEWTARIKANTAKPHHRRIWTVEEQECFS